MKRRDPIAKLIMAVWFSVFASGCSTMNGFKLWMPEWFGMERVNNYMYADPNMSEQKRNNFVELVSDAKGSVENYFGSLMSYPDVFACSTEACYQQYGGVTSRAKAYGNSKLLLSPRGITTPVIAHEWSHAELYTQLGGYSNVKKIPAWFNEGLAVMVSSEPSHSVEAWNDIKRKGVLVPQISNLITKEDWLAAIKKYGDEEASTNPNKSGVVYASAGHEVRMWFNKGGTEKLAQFIELINQGINFEEAYHFSNGEQ